MPSAQFSKIFLIGFNRSGGNWFKHVFRAAGIGWRHDQSGRMAIDLAYHKATGTKPFTRWPQLTGISRLDRWTPPILPKIEGYRHFAFLEEQFPDALFIFNDRDPADWIASRFFFRDGWYAECDARHHGCELRDLPQIWLKERVAHKLRVLRHFEGNPRFLHFNVSQDEDSRLVDWVRPWVTLGDIPQDRGIETPDESLSQIDMLSKELRKDVHRPRYRPGQPDMEFVDGVVRQCLGEFKDGAVPGDNRVLRGGVAQWLSRDGVFDLEGKRMPLARDEALGFLAPDHHQAYARVQSVLNELLAIGATPPITLDMQDAREATAQDLPPAGPTLVYNRRPGAKNLILWPLPGYHFLAPQGMPGGFAPDPFSFDEKPDLCIWFGNLTGKPKPELSGDLTPEGISHQYLKEIAAGVDPARRREIKTALDAITRYRVVSRLFGKPGFNLGLVLPKKHEIAAQDPLIAPYTAPQQPSTWVQTGRYILSLSGNDTGSNFLASSAANGVVLKEEDGWELFYTHAFKPWEHYIPLAPGGDDVEEKLDWARSNARACQEMSRNASEMVAKFAAPENRRAWSLAIWEKLRAHQR